jgi:hypothetical protein
MVETFDQSAPPAQATTITLQDSFRVVMPDRHRPLTFDHSYLAVNIWPSLLGDLREIVLDSPHKPSNVNRQISMVKVEPLMFVLTADVWALIFVH